VMTMLVKLLPTVGLPALELAAALSMPFCDGWGECPSPPVCKGCPARGEKFPDLEY
jgi:hypothetical protein